MTATRAYAMSKARNASRYNKRMDPIQRTPQALFDQLNDEFGFTLDAAASVKNAKCSVYFTETDDGRIQPWAPHVVWCNPPFGKGLEGWVRKGYEESARGATVVMLLPVMSDMAWWHRYAMNGEIRFIRGRVRFLTESGARQGNPFFPCAIVIFRPTAINSGRVVESKVT